MHVKANLICIVTSRPYPQSDGGEEGYVRQFTHFLASRAIPHTVVSSARLPGLPRLEPVNVPAFSIPVIDYGLHSTLWSLLALLRMVKINASTRIDIMYAVDTRWSGLAAAVAATLLGVPLIVNAQSRRNETLKKLSESQSNLKWWFFRAWERQVDILVTSSAARVIVSNEDGMRLLKDRGVPQYNILLAGPVIEFGSSEADSSSFENETMFSKILGFIRLQD